MALAKTTWILPRENACTQRTPLDCSASNKLQNEGVLIENREYMYKIVLEAVERIDMSRYSDDWEDIESIQSGESMFRYIN